MKEVILPLDSALMKTHYVELWGSLHKNMYLLEWVQRMVRALERSPMKKG